MKGVIIISATFWNMRRRLRAQKQAEKAIADIASSQAEEKQEQAKKPIKKAGGKRDKQGNSRS